MRVSAALFACCKTTAYLHSFGTQCHTGQHGPPAAYTTCCNNRNTDRIGHHRYQAQGGGLFPSVVSAGLKSLSYHCIAARIFHFLRKLHTAHHMYHFDAMFFQGSSVCFWITGTGKYDGYFFFYDGLNMLIDIRIQHRHIDRKWFVSSSFALAHMRFEHIGIHASAAYDTQSAGIAHSTGQFPAGTPDHTCLDDGISDLKQVGDTIFHQLMLCDRSISVLSPMLRLWLRPLMVASLPMTEWCNTTSSIFE